MSSGRRWIAAALLASLAGVWLQTPSPEFSLRDPDAGSQLAGAQEMAFFGGWPGLTFDHTSGVLRFAVSAAVQRLAGPRLTAELVLVLLASSIGYAVFFLVAVRAGGSPVVALATTGLASLLLPRSHKYYVVLLPALMLLAIQFWTATHSRRALAGMALAIAAATLYRHDYGVFCYSAAAAALLLDRGPRSLKLRRLARLTAISFGSVGVVWWLLLGPLESWRYLTELASLSRSQAGGMALPHPLLHYQDPALSVIFAGFYGAAILWALVAFPGSSASREGGGTQALFLKSWAVLAAVSLVQTAHRADLGHLFQGVPTLVAALPVLWLIGRRGTPTFRRQLSRAALGLLVVASLVAAAHIRPRHLSPISSWRAYAAGLERPSVMAARLSGSSWGRLADRIHRCTETAEPIIVWPFSPQMHYFSERPFGSRFPIIGPGFFTGPAQLQRGLDGLAAAPPRLVLWDTRHAYDRRPERRSTETHRPLFEFVRSHYEPAGSVRAGTRNFTVWAHSGRPGAREAAHCLAAERPGG